MSRKITGKIPRARVILEDLLLTRDFDRGARHQISLALNLMYRAPYKRRAKAKPLRIDSDMRRRIRAMSRNYPDMTEHEIANAVGLRSSGRISEVLHGKR